MTLADAVIPMDRKQVMRSMLGASGEPSPTGTDEGLNPLTLALAGVTLSHVSARFAKAEALALRC